MSEKAYRLLAEWYRLLFLNGNFFGFFYCLDGFGQADVKNSLFKLGLCFVGINFGGQRYRVGELPVGAFHAIIIFASILFLLLLFTFDS
jgi:hypothetical protein